MRTRTFGRLLAAGAALAALQAAPAHAVVLNCGDTVSVDTRLTADVGPCPTNTVAISLSSTAPGITLDLHGHRVIGADTTGAGVDMDAVGQTVTNGRIENFGIGVDTAQDSVVSRLRIAGSGTGVLALGGSGHTITRNRIDDVLNGVEITSSDRDQVTRNIVRDCTSTGIFAITTTNLVVERNLVTDCAADGFELSDVDLVELTDNRALRNGADGFKVPLRGNITLTKNRAEDNGDDGIDAPFSIDGGRNRAKNNADQQCIGVVCRP